MYYFIETTKSGRLEFRGRPVRTQYEAQRQAEALALRGKTVKIHSFQNNLLAEVFVAERNNSIDAARKALRAVAA